MLVSAGQCKEISICRVLHTLPKNPVHERDANGSGLHNRRSGAAIPAAEWAAGPTTMSSRDSRVTNIYEEQKEICVLVNAEGQPPLIDERSSSLG